MAIIKKITMYVAIDESKLLNDSYYKERIEDDIEEGYTQEESLSNRASDALELIMENAIYNVYVQVAGVHAALIAGGLRILSLETYGFQGAVSIFYVGSLRKNILSFTSKDEVETAFFNRIFD